MITENNKFDNNNALQIHENIDIKEYEKNRYEILRRHDLAISSAISNELYKISPFRDIKITTSETIELVCVGKDVVRLFTNVFILWNEVREND